MVAIRMEKQENQMIRKVPDHNAFRLYSKDKNTNGQHKNLGTFLSRKQAVAHERAVEFFKHGGKGK